MGGEIILVIIAVVVLLYLLAFLVKGMIKTFLRQPIVAILCVIFLFPIWIIWAIIEALIDD